MAKLNIICWCKSHLSPDSTPLRNSNWRPIHSAENQGRKGGILMAISMYVTAMETTQSFPKN